MALYLNKYTITREDIISAMKQLDKEGIPAGRGYINTPLIYNNKRYPCKYTLEVAAKINSPKQKIQVNEHITHEAVRFLDSLGFGGENFEKALGEK